ncbi:uncharacterized protein LOC130657291 [Hydractinia symbiolongicarpus]|uniref:uncharacterized protein LOC130657291 n=1 Tax=Hydractinia symbiolongicarpus TaxID=13093 RepID=UPI002549D5C2|nr:uncharacterized protein LOC130657291 [Hydractinia symbiolongicarpus]
MVAVYLRVSSLVLLLLLVTRFLLSSLTFASSAVCAADGFILEACQNSTHTILVQRNSDAVVAVGAFMEACNSFILLIIISLWKYFDFKTFIINLYVIEQSWVWFGLVTLQSIAAMYTDLVHAGIYKTFLGISTVFEIFLSAILALAISRIERKIIKNWINQTEKGYWNKLFIILYDVTLLSYVFGHLGFLLYDTALVARSVSLSNAKSNAKKDWTSFLLVMSVALRGSFAGFFFTTFFKDRKKYKVCSDEFASNGDVLVNEPTLAT